MSCTCRLRSCLSLFLFIVVLTLAACADWKAKFWADPPAQRVVPWTPSLEQTAAKVYPSLDSKDVSDEIKSFNYYLYKKPIKSREDEWAKALRENLHHLMGWRPDFCALVKAKNASGDSWLQEMDDTNQQC